jgi:hypothetical protein
MKWITALLCAAVAVWTAWQSYHIAVVGTTNGIPQLEGDGGGGILFAGLCLLAAVALLWRPVISVILLTLAAMVIVLTGFLYEDSTMYLWGAAAVVLAILGAVTHRQWRMRREMSGLHFYR